MLMFRRLRLLRTERIEGGKGFGCVEEHVWRGWKMTSLVCTEGVCHVE